MNRIILSGLVLASVLAITFGALCTPDQWEGLEGSLGGYVHHRRPGIMKESAMVSYDAKNKRKASFITYVTEDHESKFQMIVRYDGGDDSGKAYIVDLKKDKCWVKVLKEPFKKACIPDDAQHTYDYSLGLKGKGGLAVSGYEVSKKGLEVALAVSKAGDAIIPVTESIYGNIWGTSFVQGMGFVNITPGIKNETVFDIPKQCNEADDVSMAEFLKRQNFVLAI